MNLLGEEWKDIEGLKGKYQVSNLGRVRSFSSRGKGRVLKQSVDKDGYLRINLTGEKSKKLYYKIHRLVALHFIPNPQNKPEVNHRLGNKKDNRAGELEWSTTKENIVHAYNILRRRGSWAGKKRGRLLDNVRAKKVNQIDPITGIVVKTWERINDAARAGFIQSKISDVCNGNRQTTGGYRWSFIN